ncbi:hypothetical protein QL285_007060 [Trifolium repens]|nr:hypothetical protein QL285_007060 [Trifolium repens]
MSFKLKNYEKKNYKPLSLFQSFPANIPPYYAAIVHRSCCYIKLLLCYRRSYWYADGCSPRTLTRLANSVRSGSGLHPYPSSHRPIFGTWFSKHNHCLRCDPCGVTVVFKLG